MQTTSAKRPIHVGRNIQKIRLFRSLSQTDLAISLGEKQHRIVSQQNISEIESKETIEDDELLKQIGEILEVSPEALKEMDFDSAISVIGNTFTNQAGATGNYNLPIYHGSTVNQTYNDLDKLITFFKEEREELRKQTEELKAEIENLKKKGKKK